MSGGDVGSGAALPASPPAVPVGWQRTVRGGSVCYISPSGTALASPEQARAYLLADGTCKCGLQCPLDMRKVFDFDPGAAVAGRGAPGVRGQQDMTKLCNHRRKTAAAALCRSVEGTPSPGAGPVRSPLFSAGGHPATGAGVPLPSSVGSFPGVPPGAKTPEAASAPPGTLCVAPPSLQPHDSIPGADGSPESRPPCGPCFGLRLPPPDAETPPAPSVLPLHPTGSTSGRAALARGATGESPEPGLCLPAPPGAPQSSGYPPVPAGAPVGKQPPVRGSLWSWHPDPQEPAAPRVPPEPTGTHPAVTGQPLAALLSLLGAPGCRGVRGPGGPSLPTDSLPATSGSPCPGTGLLPADRDSGRQLLALLRQLAASSEPTAGTPPRPKASGRNGGPALGQPPAACGGDPAGPSLPSPLAASLLPLPLGIPLPALDPLPSLGTLLSTRLRLPPAAPPSSLASPALAPTSTAAPSTTAEAPRGGGQAPDSPPGTPERLDPPGPQPGSCLLGTALLGSPPAPSPLIRNPLLLPPTLGLSPGSGSPPGTGSPLAGRLRSLQLGPTFSSPEKSATPLGPSTGGSPSPSTPPGLPEGTPSALEPPVSCPAEPGGSRPSGGAPGCPPPGPPLKRGRWQAEGLGRETPSLWGPPSTKTPRRGAARGGWGTQWPLNGQAGGRGKRGLPPTAPPAPHPAWRCNGDIPATGQQLRAENIKGSSLHPRASCRGWRRKASTPRPSAHPETLQWRGLSAHPSPATELAAARCPWPGRPVRSRRRKLPT